MNLIDISSWQHGLDLAGLFSQNPDLDGVMVKLTQGTGYVNPDANAWITWLTLNRKPFGTYHYLDGSGATAEAQHYAAEAKKWPGGVLAIDYEDAVLRNGTGYLKECLDEVYRLTGIRPLVYCSQISALEAQNFSAIAAAGYKLWVAQYADFSPVYGFLETPWHKGSVAPFKSYVMQQYTSCGVLDGWKSYLDLDKYFGTAEEWRAMCGARPAPEPAPPAELKGPDPVVVSEVLMNRYGVGQERIAKLKEAGYDPQKVQAKIDELYAVAFKVKPLVAGNMEYMNSIVKIVKTI